MQQALDISEAIPLYANLPPAAYEVMSDLLEYAFRVLTGVQFAFADKLTIEFKEQICVKIYLLLGLR